ncbi:CoA transferase [Sphingomonas tagetis]|uniref:CoA transferase n=1 Tax=Sphingomonas tagetis TaxID=2949092 RepID=UPI00265DE533|nr:CoA transferase [Sphingomonas tagetis]
MLMTIEEFASDPQVQAPHNLVSLAHALLGTTVFEASPFAMSTTPAKYQGAAPTYGRDNKEVLGGILSYGDNQINALAASGAVT